MKKLLTTACLFVVTISPLVLIPVNAQRETRQTVGLEKIDLSIVEKIRDEELKRSHMSDDAQYSMDVTALRLSRPPAMNQLAAGTRVLVHYDMEGMAGQDDWRSAAAWWPEQYARGQQLLAKDVNAVVAGLFDGGAEIVDVIDQHGSGNPGFNLPPELLDRRVRHIFIATMPQRPTRPNTTRSLWSPCTPKRAAADSWHIPVLSVSSGSSTGVPYPRQDSERTPGAMQAYR